MTERTASRLLVMALGLWLSSAGCQQATSANLAEFKSDGCSMFPDGNYYSCCYLHDVLYWPGGTADAREGADKALRACVETVTGNHALAEAMYAGVRVGGVPELPTHYRWGYGWPYPYRKDYAPLTVEERKQVAEKTAALCRTIRLNPSTGRYVVVISNADREISAEQARQVCPGL